MSFVDTNSAVNPRLNILDTWSAIEALSNFTKAIVTLYCSIVFAVSNLSRDATLLIISDLVKDSLNILPKLFRLSGY